MSTKALITGVTGMVGSHLADFLLENTDELLEQNGFKVVNIDSTVVAQAPRLSPYIKKMVCNISGVLGIEENQINVKATTEENLGFTGSGEGIAAYAVCIIKKFEQE